MKKETLFKFKVRPLLDAIPKSHWFKTQMRAVRGIPDYVGCVNGRAVFLELKTLEGHADKLQLYTLQQFKKAGAYTAVVDPNNLYTVMFDLLLISKGEL